MGPESLGLKFRMAPAFFLADQRAVTSVSTWPSPCPGREMRTERAPEASCPLLAGPNEPS